MTRNRNIGNNYKMTIYKEVEVKRVTRRQRSIALEMAKKKDETDSDEEERYK